MNGTSPGRRYFNTDMLPQGGRFPVRETPSGARTHADCRCAIRIQSFGGEQQ